VPSYVRGMSKLIKLAVLSGVLMMVSMKGPALAKLAHAQAQQVKTTQNACAAHTAAVNEVLDFLK
jgi:hypothetical protein